jgi:hypothetical protein
MISEICVWSWERKGFGFGERGRGEERRGRFGLEPFELLASCIESMKRRFRGRSKIKIRREKRTSHLTPALSPTKRCGGEGETISALTQDHARGTGEPFAMENEGVLGVKVIIIRFMGSNKIRRRGNGARRKRRRDWRGLDILRAR